MSARFYLMFKKRTEPKNFYFIRMVKVTLKKTAQVSLLETR